MKTAEDFNREQEEMKAKEDKEKESKPKVKKMNKAGTKYICGHAGCESISFKEEENGPDKCKYHTGEAIFHDLKKYWTCCCANKPAYDWDDFQKIPKCASGEHIFKYV